MNPIPTPGTRFPDTHHPEKLVRLAARLVSRYLTLARMVRKGATVEAVATKACDAARLCGDYMPPALFAQMVMPALTVARAAVGERWPGCVGDEPPMDVDRCCLWNALEVNDYGLPGHPAALDILTNWRLEMTEGPWSEGHALTYLWRIGAACVVTTEDVATATKADITITHIKALVSKGLVGEAMVYRLSHDMTTRRKVTGWYITAEGYRAATGEPAPLSVLEAISRCDILSMQDEREG